MVQYSSMSTETRRLVRTDSPGRPPRLSHSSRTMQILSQQLSDDDDEVMLNVLSDDDDEVMLNVLRCQLTY